MKRWQPRFRASIVLFLGVLCVATFVLWLRSYRHQDALRWRTHTATNYRVYTLCSAHGELAIDRSDFQPWPADQGEYGFEFFTDRLEPGAAYTPAWRAWFEFAAGSTPAADNASRFAIVFGAAFAEGFIRNDSSNAVAAVMFGVVPFWFIALLAALIPLRGTFHLLRAARRRRMRLCPNCAYNLTGNTSGVCPECGGKVQVRA